MHDMTIPGLRRPDAGAPDTAPASVGPANATEDSRSAPRIGSILTACGAWGLVLALHFLAAPAAKAAPPSEDDHAQFTPAVCYELVQDAGRMIAWARWEQHFPLEKTRSAPFPPNTPPWMITLVQDWITDAYQWQATDEQILQWASELGNVDNLPHPAQLSAHETIAIWMRHIARQCSARSA
jgi:hypothetical protein